MTMTADTQTLPAELGSGPGVPAQAEPFTDFRPRNMSEALKFCEFISRTDFVPSNFRGKSADIFCALQYGAELGMGPMQSLRCIAVVNGRASMWGDMMLGKVQGSPVYEWHDESESNDKQGVCAVKRKGGKVHRVVFTVEDAKRAGLWGKSGPWTQHPNRMLKLRARAFALRDQFADVLGGIPMAEEAMDMPPEQPAGSVTVIPPETPKEKGDAILEKISRKRGKVTAELPESSEPPVPVSSPATEPLNDQPGDLLPPTDLEILIQDFKNAMECKPTLPELVEVMNEFEASPDLGFQDKQKLRQFANQQKARLAKK